MFAITPRVFGFHGHFTADQVDKTNRLIVVFRPRPTESFANFRDHDVVRHVADA